MAASASSAAGIDSPAPPPPPPPSRPSQLAIFPADAASVQPSLPSQPWAILERLPSSTWTEGAQQYELRAETISVGRSKWKKDSSTGQRSGVDRQHFVFPLKLISGKHCSIKRYNGKAKIYDHSTNGTYVDGARIGRGNVKIVSNDVNISFGQKAVGRSVPEYRLILCGRASNHDAEMSLSSDASATLIRDNEPGEKTATSDRATTDIVEVEEAVEEASQHLNFNRTSSVTGADKLSSETVNAPNVARITDFRPFLSGAPGTYIGDVDEHLLPHGLGVVTSNISDTSGKVSSSAQYQRLRMRFFRGEAVASSIGELTFQDGRVYEGTFSKSGRPHGFGSEVRSDGDRYTGMWQRGRRHGLGVRTWSEGQTYCGQWTSGKMDGFGVFIWPSGLQYFGEWSVHKRHGLGVEMNSDPETPHFYCGEWKAGKREGFGKRCKHQFEQLWSGSFTAGHRNRLVSDDGNSEEQGHQAAQHAMVAADEALAAYIDAMKSIGKNLTDQLADINVPHDADKGKRHELTQRIKGILQQILANAESPLCQISVRNLLEAASGVRRRERNTFEAAGLRKWGSDSSVWTKATAQLFGQVLRRARLAEQGNKKKNAAVRLALDGIRSRINDSNR